MELPKRNMQLLVETPAACPELEAFNFRPELPPGFYWNKIRHSILCWYFDGVKWRSKTKALKRTATVSTMVEEAAAIVQNLKDFMEEHDRSGGREYDEGNDEAEAESATDEVD